VKSIIISDEIHKRIKQQALDENTTIQEIFRRAIEEYLQRKRDDTHG
jgi:predicted transcriptional regulator